MGLTKKEVDYVAGLARLSLSEEEKELMARQLTNILEYMDKLNELDTADVNPTSHVLPLSNVFREDEVVPSFPREKMLSSAPENEKGHYRVPRIIED